MNEEHLIFLEELGAGIRYQDVPEEFFKKFKNEIPDSLLEFWREEGWSSYAKGLLWTVNPEDYAWLVDGWVKGFSTIPESNYYVFARSAFGEFYCLSVNSRRILTISCPRALLVAPEEFFKVERSADVAIDIFFSMAEREEFDFFDDDDTPLFDRALKRLGPLSADEVYGFVPVLPMGEEAAVENLSKLRMDVHIEILKQSAEIELQIL